MVKKIFTVVALAAIHCITYAQVGINTETPSPNAALHVNSPNEDLGVIVPQVPSAISLLEVVKTGVLTLPDGTKLAFDADGLVFYNLETGCYTYWRAKEQSWFSICGTPAPAVFTIDCQKVTAVGVYIEGQTFGINNYLQVYVEVSEPGTYTITATTPEGSPAGNGYYFSASGIFPQAGGYTVTLAGAGTPIAADPDGNAIDFEYNGSKSTSCFSLGIQTAQPDYCIIGAKQMPSTPWPVAPTALDASYYAEVTLQVNKPGVWQITTGGINGVTFSGTGLLQQASGYNPYGTFPQNVTVNVPIVLPATAASNNPSSSYYTLSTLNSACRAQYPLVVNWAQVGFSIDGGCDVGIDVSDLGTLKQGVNVDPAKRIRINLTNVTGGMTQITAQFAGLSYSTSPTNVAGNPGEIDITSLAYVDLYPATVPQSPNQSGSFAVNIASSGGGFDGCGATPKMVTVAGAAALFNEITITSFTNNDQWVMNPMSGGDDTPCDMVLSVKTSEAGDYNLETPLINGVQWKGTGSVAAGNSTVILHPTSESKASASGPQSVTLLNYPKPGDPASGPYSGVTNAKICYFVQRTINVLFMGSAAYSGYGNNAGRLWSSPSNFGPTGVVGVKAFKGFNHGTSSTATALRNSINTNKIDIIVVGYNWIPGSATQDVLADFVNRIGGVLIFSAQNRPADCRDLVYKISGVTVNFGNTGSSTRLNRVVGVNDVDINPFIDGKFGLIRDLYIGNDLTDSQPVQATSVPTPLKTIVTVCDDGAGNNFVWGFSDPRKGFIYLSDPGWLSGHTTTYASSDTRYPLYLNGSNYPAAKPTPYSFAGSCQTSAQQVWNSVLFANILAWAVDYAAAHRDVTLNAQP